METKHNEIVIEKINAGNAVEAGKVIAYVFHNIEPVTSNLGLEPGIYEKMMGNFCRVVSENDLCFLARVPNTNKMAGAITSIDLEFDFGEKFRNEPDFYSEVLEKLAPDIAMTTELEKKYWDSFEYGECLHLFQLAILPDYWRKHVGQALLERTLKDAVVRGYKFAIADCTSLKSQRMLEKYGFNKDNSMKYSDFVFEGRKPFANMEGEYILMVKELV